MDAKCEAALRERLQTLVDTMSESLLNAIVLRVDVHLELAFGEGAEDEDIGDIIEQALESMLPITKKFLDVLGEVEKANAISKSKG